MDPHRSAAASLSRQTSRCADDAAESIGGIVELDDLEQEILLRLAAGEAVVSRLVTMRWFTYEADGKSFVVGPEMQQRFESVAGAHLVEFTPADHPADRALGFRAADLPHVRQALLARGYLTGQEQSQNGRS
jgi:hypothetical protein